MSDETRNEFGCAALATDYCRATADTLKDGLAVAAQVFVLCAAVGLVFGLVLLVGQGFSQTIAGHSWAWGWAHPVSLYGYGLFATLYIGVPLGFVLRGRLPAAREVRANWHEHLCNAKSRRIWEVPCR